jgi:hypothetical protein
MWGGSISRLGEVGGSESDAVDGVHHGALPGDEAHLGSRYT